MLNLSGERVLFFTVAVTAKTFQLCIQIKLTKKETKARFYNVLLADYNCFMCFKLCTYGKYQKNNKILS